MDVLHLVAVKGFSEFGPCVPFDQIEAKTFVFSGPKNTMAIG